MTYNPSIPQPTDLISTSQGQILINFGQLNTQFGVDHVAFNTGSGNGTGFHKKITFPGTTSPVPTPSGTVSNLYVASIGGKQELIFKNATTTSQLTNNGGAAWNNSSVALTNASSNQNNKMILPNGVVMIWGVISSPPSGNSTATFPGGGFPTACLNVQLTGARDNSSSTQSIYINSHAAGGYTNGLSATGFKFSTTSSNFTQIYYWAIGY